MSVMSTVLPRKSNFAIAHAAATPKTQFNGTAMAAAMKVSRMAASVSGSSNASKIEADALGKRLRENRRQRHDQKQAEKQQRDADQQPAHERRLGRHAAGSGAARGVEGCKQEIINQTGRVMAWLHQWSKLMASNSKNETTSITTAMAVAPG